MKKNSFHFSTIRNDEDFDASLRDRFDALYEPSDGDTFVHDTLQRLPHRYVHKLAFVAVFAVLWSSVLGLLIAFRHTIYAALKAMIHAIATFELPSTDVLLTMLFFGALLVFAVYESCDTVCEYIELTYRRSDGSSDTMDSIY